MPCPDFATHREFFVVVEFPIFIVQQNLGIIFFVV